MWPSAGASRQGRQEWRPLALLPRLQPPLSSEAAVPQPVRTIRLHRTPHKLRPNSMHRSILQTLACCSPGMAAARRSWVLRGVIRGFSEEARTRGFPSPSFGGFGFIGVASDQSIAAGWQFGGRSPMSASGGKADPGWSRKLPKSQSAFGHKRPFT